MSLFMVNSKIPFLLTFFYFSETCSTGGDNNCLSCDLNKFRELITLNKCECKIGFYDDG